MFLFPGQMRHIETARLNTHSLPPGIDGNDPTAKSIFRCVCGGRCRFKERIPERGIIVLVCTSQGCGTEYSYPIDHPLFKNCTQENNSITALQSRRAKTGAETASTW